MSGTTFKVTFVFKDVNQNIAKIDAMKLGDFEFRNLNIIKE